MCVAKEYRRLRSKDVLLFKKRRATEFPYKLDVPLGESRALGPRTFTSGSHKFHGPFVL